MPRDDRYLLRRAARRYGVVFKKPIIRLTRLVETPPPVRDEFEVIPVSPLRLIIRRSSQVRECGSSDTHGHLAKRHGDQEPLNPLRSGEKATFTASPISNVAGAEVICVGIPWSSSGLGLVERWRVRIEELFGPDGPPSPPDSLGQIGYLFCRQPGHLASVSVGIFVQKVYVTCIYFSQ